VQALVVRTDAPSPRRTITGLDGGRMAMVLAVLERRQSLIVGRCDVYLAPVGGARLTEPAADLAAALAAYGSLLDVAVPLGWVAFGEIGLAGEVRRVPGARQRVAEAARLGMTDVVLPRSDAEALPERAGIRVHGVDDLADALLLVPWAAADSPMTPPPPMSGPRMLGLRLEP
jgi:DNA repair protein RadA/Sms